ncbi:helix-turn-helix transcriptional regulator [Salinicola halimionae]|uniref:helix-turn-helix transcriptional regulator n=1 Tax=Salinicola halimionae TaxID=1949081 RepID=UPI000DA153D0|nr:helix-turn-helix transcriptional regulator [Salinicola halimionae]
MSELGSDRYASHSPLYQLIADLSDGIVLLNPDGALCWANPAALEMHGVETLEELGPDVDAYRERFDLYYRNHHEVGEGRSPMERLLDGESFDDVILEVRPADADAANRYHRVRGKTLIREGRPDALALIIEDITELMSAEERFERSFNANPAPALICRLDNQRFIRVNQGFLDMMGLTAEEVVQRSIYEFDVFAHSPQRDSAIRRLCAGQPIPQTEALLHLGNRSDESKCVIVAGQPIEVDRTACMLLTFTDLEPARQAQHALRQSEALFATAFQMSPVPTALVSADSLTLIEANAAFEKGLVRRVDASDPPSLEDYSPFTPHTRRQLLSALESADRVEDMEVHGTGDENNAASYLLAAEAVKINMRDCLLLTLVDISERKRYESQLSDAIDAVMKDASWFTRTLVEKLANVRDTNTDASLSEQTVLAGLSARERDVLSLICEGLSDKRIAGRLKLAHSTVRNYVASLYQKLGVHSRGEAIVWARQRGFHSRMEN